MLKEGVVICGGLCDRGGRQIRQDSGLKCFPIKSPEPELPVHSSGSGLYLYFAMPVRYSIRIYIFFRNAVVANREIRHLLRVEIIQILCLWLTNDYWATNF